MSETLERLKAGARRFRKEVYDLDAEHYRRIASEPQRPHTLVIACADSRVDVETLTGSKPGDIFVARNIGNMVPPYGEVLGGVSAVIEYAVQALHVQHVMICGHSDCGAMKALLSPQSTDEMPTVRRWLNHGQAALKIAEFMQSSGGGDRLPILTEQNVLLQIAHLRTHPSVAGALARGALSVSGWVYEIGSGEVRISANGDGVFTPVSERGTSAHPQ